MAERMTRNNARLAPYVQDAVSFYSLHTPFTLTSLIQNNEPLKGVYVYRHRVHKVLDTMHCIESTEPEAKADGYSFEIGFYPSMQNCEGCPCKSGTYKVRDKKVEYKCNLLEEADVVHSQQGSL